MHFLNANLPDFMGTVEDKMCIYLWGQKGHGDKVFSFLANDFYNAGLMRTLKNQLSNKTEGLGKLLFSNEQEQLGITIWVDGSYYSPQQGAAAYVMKEMY